MLHWESAGTGLPLVFLHAFPLSRQMWDPNRHELSKHFRVITIDLPGFGQSAGVGEVATMEAMAKEVLLTLDHAKISEKKVFAGLSMGGYVLFQILKLAPELIRAAVFVSTRAAADTEETRLKRSKNIELVDQEGIAAFADRQVPVLLGPTSLQNRSSVVEQVRTWAGSANPAGVKAALRGMAQRPDMTDAFKETKFPALFISGAEDRVVGSAEMEAISTLRSNTEYRLVEQAGHLLNLECPQPFGEIFSQFLKRRVL